MVNIIHQKDTYHDEIGKFPQIIDANLGLVTTHNLEGPM